MQAVQLLPLLFAVCVRLHNCGIHSAPLSGTLFSLHAEEAAVQTVQLDDHCDHLNSRHPIEHVGAVPVQGGRVRGHQSHLLQVLRHTARLLEQLLCNHHRLHCHRHAHTDSDHIRVQHVHNPDRVCREQNAQTAAAGGVLVQQQQSEQCGAQADRQDGAIREDGEQEFVQERATHQTRRAQHVQPEQ